MHAPSSRTCSPPSTAANDGPPNPRMGPISGQTLARQAGLAQAWQRYPHPSRCLALRPGLFHFSQERAIFPGQPFPCPPFGVQASASLVFSALSPDQTCPIAVALLFLFLLFLFCLLRVRVRPNSSPWAAQVSLFFENTAPTSLVPSFTSSALLYALPLSTVTDSSSSIDARPSTPPPQPRPSSFFSSIQHTHTLVLSFYSPDCFVEPPPQDPTIPTPGLQTSCRHPIPSPSPSTDRRSIALPPFARAQRHQHRARPHFCFSTSNFSTCFRQQSAR